MATKKKTDETEATTSEAAPATEQAAAETEATPAPPKREPFVSGFAVGEKVTIEGTVAELHGENIRLNTEGGGLILHFSKIAKALLVLLISGWLIALPGHALAADQVFDDPAQASHPNILAFASVSANQQSIPFSSGAMDKGLVVVRLTSCVGPCNITFQLWATAIGGLSSVDLLWCTDSTAITATGTYFYTIMQGSDTANAGSGSPTGIKLHCNRPLPPQWFVVLVWNSGTSMIGSVKGYAWQ